MKFEFAAPGRILFGEGQLAAAGDIAKAAGRHPLVVVGRDASRASRLLALLQAQSLAITTYSVPGEPELETVRQGVAAARSAGCDFVIGMGGGSVIDAGKAIAAMLRNEGDLLEYVEVIGRGKPLAHSSAAYVAIPTTAGTGSEATRNAVLASPEHRVKVSLRSASMIPGVALVDPELTYDLPPVITASTGLDALTQLIEPYVCARANPMTDSICVEGIRRAAAALPAAFRNGADRAARRDMALASLFGGLALANAGLGAVHGFAGPLGGMFPAPHGALCAALLPHVMAANIAALRARRPDHPSLRRYEEVARLLTGNPAAGADAGVEWVRQLVADLNIAPLRNYGIDAGHTQDIIRKAAQASSMKANPIELTEEELAGILGKAI
ncbi:MAG: iron-containing alcohol dehydrogenase [Verrucomicrobiota bacterium]